MTRTLLICRKPTNRETIMLPGKCSTAKEKTLCSLSPSHPPPSFIPLFTELKPTKQNNQRLKWISRDEKNS